MSENPFAFPKAEAFDARAGHSGMSLRDYFAAKTLAALIGEDRVTIKEDAAWAYAYADAMLAEREVKP